MTPEQRQFGAQLFAALANPGRLRILEFLAAGPASVKAISETTGLKQSITSQHLATLLNAGVLVSTPSGNQRIYRLRGPRIARILTLVEEFHEAHLESLREVLARHGEEAAPPVPGEHSESGAHPPPRLPRRPPRQAPSQRAR